MDNFEKRQAVMAELLQDASRSDRTIGEKLGLSPGLVGKVRKQLEHDGKLEPGKRLGKDGKRRGQPHQEPAGTEAAVRPHQDESPRLKAVVMPSGDNKMPAAKVPAAVSHQDVPDRDHPPSKPIHGFNGEYAWLSNSWPAPVKLDDMQFPNVEAAFQAAKTLDLKVRATIAALPTAEEAKEMGKHITVRPDWDTVKLSIMEDLLRQKFANPELQRNLEGTWDVHLEDTDDCKADNFLGRLLMKVRKDELSKLLLEFLARRVGLGDGQTEEAAPGVGQGQTVETVKEEPQGVLTLDKDFMEKNRKT